MPTLVARGRAGELPPLVDPRTARDFVYVDDVCEAFLAAANAQTLERGTVLNVGSGQQTTLADLIAIARMVFAIDAEPQWATYAQRSWDTNVWVADVQLIGETLGWRAIVDLETGFRRTAEWFAADAAAAARYHQQP